MKELEGRIRQCNPGHLRRFLCWFGGFDEFLYSDNDIVALMNWEELFPYLENYDIVHADREFTTGGKFNMRQPDRFEELMGAESLQAAMTAGHFLCRRSPRHAADLLAGISWMEAHPEVPIWHDQALMHVTLVLAQWRVLNLCREPHRWASSWAGDYKNVLDLIRTIQVERRPISHLHYSGGIATGTEPIDELLSTSLPAKERNRKLLRALLWQASGLRAIERPDSPCEAQNQAAQGRLEVTGPSRGGRVIRLTGHMQAAKTFFLPKLHRVAEFLFSQGITIACNLLYGLLCIRLLPIGEYAKFVVVFAVQGSLMVLLDVGISAILHLAGRRTD